MRIVCLEKALAMIRVGALQERIKGIAEWAFKAPGELEDLKLIDNFNSPLMPYYLITSITKTGSIDINFVIKRRDETSIYIPIFVYYDKEWLIEERDIEQLISTIKKCIEVEKLQIS